MKPLVSHGAKVSKPKVKIIQIPINTPQYPVYGAKGDLYGSEPKETFCATMA